MRFGTWIPLEDAAAQAPDIPGMLQARSDDLVVYPRGKSAMVLYACPPDGATLAAYLRDPTRLAQALACGARWIRFGPTDHPAREQARLLAHFTERFGAPPPRPRIKHG